MTMKLRRTIERWMTMPFNRKSRRDRQFGSDGRVDVFVLGQNVARAGLSDAAAKQIFSLVLGEGTDPLRQRFEAGRQAPPESAAVVSVVSIDIPQADVLTCLRFSMAAIREGWKLTMASGAMRFEPIGSYGSKFTDEDDLATFLCERAWAYSPLHMEAVALARHHAPDFYFRMLAPNKRERVSFRDHRPEDEEDPPSFLLRNR